jgi:hypothetical protein
VLAAELQSISQRERLSDRYGLPVPTEGPFLDIYLLAFDPPKAGRYREHAFIVTAKLSQKLPEYRRVSRHIRRIAYLEAFGEGTAMQCKRYSLSAPVLRKARHRLLLLTRDSKSEGSSLEVDSLAELHLASRGTDV